MGRCLTPAFFQPGRPQAAKPSPVAHHEGNIAFVEVLELHAHKRTDAFRGVTAAPFLLLATGEPLQHARRRTMAGGQSSSD